jgi:hypothetical protein
LTTLLGHDLEVPFIGEDDDAIEVEENEDEDGDLDDYQDFGLENILIYRLVPIDYVFGASYYELSLLNDA